MAKPTDTVKPWATSGSYPASTYPINLPWDVPNPVGGDPTPWSNQSRLDAADITAFAAAGHTPQIPTSAESENRWLNTVYQCCAWVDAGTSAPDATAHIVETEASGLCKALAFEATAAIQGVGGTQAPLSNGAIINAGKTLTLTGDANIAGGTDSDVSVETTTVTERRWVDSTTILPSAPGRWRWNDTFYSVHDAAGNIHTLDEPSRGYLSVLNTPNAITDGPSCERRVKYNEPVWITIGCRYEGDVALANINYRIAVTGPGGTLDAMIDVQSIDIAGKGYTLLETLQFTPTDLWPGELLTQGYSFKFRAGVSGGNLAAKRLHISAVSAIQI